MFRALRGSGRLFLLGILLMLAVSIPASAQSAPPDSPTLSITERLDDRRYVVTGDRAYTVGTEAGRFPAMGFHTRGEMGGVWSPPIKLLDGLWFGVDDEWIGPATKFTSGYGHVMMDLPGREGLSVKRTDFVPDGERAVLVGLEFTAGDAAQDFTLKMDAHSELMGAYPWGETNPSQTDFNIPDEVSVDGGKLVFEETGTPPVANALPHDWAAVVGSNLTPTGSETSETTGQPYRGPQGDVICPASGPNSPEAPRRCDDTAYGKGAGGQLRYDMSIDPGETETVWFAVSGADLDAPIDSPAPTGARAAALATNVAVLADPEASLQQKIESRLALQENTKLSLPGDPRLAQSIDWSKQNLADSVQVAEDLEIRETNAGKNYPPPEGDLAEMRFLGAGFPDYQWLFGTDGEYTAFASVAVGQFEPIKDHLRALREVSLIDNGGSGKVVHEVVTDGTVYFGSNADPGNTDETAKFPSAVALIWRWTGDDAFRDEMYEFSKANMEYIFDNLDEDGDLWPEGLGNVEREGMGVEKLDNAVYTIRGLRDLAEMARSKGDTQTEAWALERAREMESRFEDEWWMPEVPQHADSIDDPDDPSNDNEKIQQRHWIGVTPMDVEMYKQGRLYPGLTTRKHGNAALNLREEECYSDTFGLYHTGEPGCDPAQSSVPAELNTFTLNTAIMAVGEGNYGRLGEDQQQRFTTANARLQLPSPDEMPGAMPEIAPSPDYGRSINRPFNERAMVLQAWGAYGTIWPVVHQQLGVRPNLGFDSLAVVPQVPSGQTEISGEDILLGEGSVDVTARVSKGTYRTVVDSRVADARLTIGHTVPRGERISSVTLDGKEVRYDVRKTNRGQEVLVKASDGGDHTLVVKTS
jgi:hypothetical protein